LWLQDQLSRIRRICATESSQEAEDWRLKIENINREWFIKTEEILHRAKDGPVWLSESEVAEKCVENLRRLDGEVYRLDAYSVMSNHVHTVFKPFLSSLDALRLSQCDDGCFQLKDHPGLSKIMHSLKGRSARECNLLLGRTGGFWEHESFDHVIRKGKFDKTIRYVLNNPVKAGLVERWEDWRWNYCRQELIERFRTVCTPDEDTLY